METGRQKRMTLETQIENRLIEKLGEMQELSACQIVGSRQIAATDTQTIADDVSADTVIAIHTGYRQHDAFSLSPITVPITIAMSTRIEKDKSGRRHESVFEAVSDQLSYWHKFSDDFTSDFTLPGVFCGEIRMTGGSGRSFDQTDDVWTDTIQFSIRGSEKYAVPVYGEGKYHVTGHFWCAPPVYDPEQPAVEYDIDDDIPWSNLRNHYFQNYFNDGDGAGLTFAIFKDGNLFVDIICRNGEVLPSKIISGTSPRISLDDIITPNFRLTGIKLKYKPQ